MNAWPELPLTEWADTCATLQLWTQVVGKIRLAHAPLVNHWWQVPLYVTSRGLTTSIIPYGSRGFQLDFDFIDHALIIQTTDGATENGCAGPAQRCRFPRRGHGAAAERWALKRGSGRCRSRFRMPCRSIRITCTRHTTRNMPSGSGASWFTPIASAQNSARGSSARSARCISSGAASISRSLGFQGVPHRS